MQQARPRPRGRGFRMPPTSAYIMAVVLLLLGFYLIWPALLLVINSFDAGRDWFVGERQWGLQHWRDAWSTPGLLVSLGNSIMIWAFVVGISFPIAVVISWVLARTNIPFSRSIEFLFWVSFMMPGIATTIVWITLLDPDIGLINVGLEKLPFINDSPFNIFSVPGIVWAHLMANGISIKVILLTPAFRNMDATMEEVSGTSNILTMMRVTLPLMISPMALVFGLQLLYIFQSFETEFLLGLPFDFYVHSTKIFELARQLDYGVATVLASLTLLVIAVIIPVQRWIIQRHRYTSITGSFKPGLIDLGPWRLPAFGFIGFLIVLLAIGPAILLLFGSFMTKWGHFSLASSYTYTLEHWQLVLTDNVFLRALRTTLILSITAAILGPLLFSLVAYILVRTRWAGRWALDLIIWGSAAIPGVLSGFGLLWLFLGTPLFSALYGTIYALLLVVIIQGTTTGTNIMKGAFVQIGADMGEAAPVAGAGWISTYFRIWIPLLMPTLLLLATLNFVIAAGTISSIIMLASRDTVTLSVLALEFAATGRLEQAGIVSLFIILPTVGLATVARAFGLRLARPPRQRRQE